MGGTRCSPAPARILTQRPDMILSSATVSSGHTVGQAPGVQELSGYIHTMASSGKSSFHLALRANALEALNRRAEAEQMREKAWLNRQRQERLETGLSRREAAAIRRELRVELAARRAAGEFAGTRDLVLTQAVREELRARKLDRKWPKPPEGELDAPGRRWGTPPSLPLGEGGYDARLSLKLPHSLAETVRRAAYWTSVEPVRLLQEWDDCWGRAGEIVARDSELSGAPVDLALAEAAMRPSAPQAALEAREKLRAQVLTTGDLLRAAVDRAGREPQQTEVPAGG